jgi:TatD DNase family protein
MAVELAEKYPFVYAAVGFHPEELEQAELSDLEEIRRLAAHEKVVAIGEIGLDYYWVKDEEGRKKEQEFFRAQLALAEELSLPVIVHDREAHGDTLAIVKEFPNVHGVFHCYSGSVEMAQELVKMGWMISFTGVLTYHNARKAVEVAEAIPLEHLMIETDSPYMAPVPHRGKRNHSGYVLHVCEKLAEIKGISVEECAKETSRNGCRFFHISKTTAP